jgi:hypothetical protein
LLPGLPLRQGYFIKFSCILMSNKKTAIGW